MFPLIEIETSREHLSQKILREYFHVHGNFVEKVHGQGLFIIFQGNFLSLLEIHGQKNNDHGPDHYFQSTVDLKSCIFLVIMPILNNLPVVSVSYRM